MTKEEFKDKWFGLDTPEVDKEFEQDFNEVRINELHNFINWHNNYTQNWLSHIPNSELGQYLHQKP
jgi:hypothetical protein